MRYKYHLDHHLKSYHQSTRPEGLRHHAYLTAKIASLLGVDGAAHAKSERNLRQPEDRPQAIIPCLSLPVLEV